MLGRVAALLRARLSGRGDHSVLPVGALMVEVAFGAALADIGREVLPPYAYALFLLALGAALVAIPLLGELGYLLRHDPAAEWVEALPVTPADLRAARTLHLFLALAILSLGALVPAALLAPAQMDLAARLALVAAGLGQALVVAAVLLGLQALLGGRAESVLVLLQTALFFAVLLAATVGLRYVPALAEIGSAQAAPRWLAMLPISWFAAAASGGGALPALGVTAAAAALLLLVPAPRAPSLARGRPGRAPRAGPLRALATRGWVRPEERGAFDLVWDGLPREREFKLRTYPLAALPLAFLVAGWNAEPGLRRDALFALIQMLPAVYLPVLLSQVPGSTSAEARWILDSAPVRPEAIARGARKAVLLRFVLPLYALLALLTWSLAGADLLLRFTLPGLLLSHLVARLSWPVFVERPPLSCPPDELAARLDWTNVLLGLAIGVTIAAIGAAAFVRTPLQGLLVAAALVALELVARRADARLPRAAS